MNLHDHLTQTLDRVDPAGPDLDRLRAVSRRRGAGIRRRRTTGIAVAASVAALALTGSVLAAVGGTGGTGTPVASDGSGAAPVISPSLAGPTAATTGEGAVLGLVWAVSQHRSGAAYDVAGQLSSTSGDFYVEVRWDDADALGATPVGLNVQHGRGMHATCDDPEQLSCRTVRLPDGSRLTTYEQRVDVPGGPGTRLVADLLRPDRMRVVASSTDGFDVSVEGGAWDRTRPAPPLSTDDLASIVRQPMWGDTLPVAFVDAGQDLAGYRDFDVENAAGWIHGTAK